MSNSYPPAAPKRLVRSTSNRVIGGVCGGVAQYLNMDANLVRILTVLISLFTGVPVILYIIALFVIPEDTASQPSAPPPVAGPQSQPGPFSATQTATPPPAYAPYPGSAGGRTRLAPRPRTPSGAARARRGSSGSPRRHQRRGDASATRHRRPTRHLRRRRHRGRRHPARRRLTTPAAEAQRQADAAPAAEAQPIAPSTPEAPVVPPPAEVTRTSPRTRTSRRQCSPDEPIADFGSISPHKATDDLRLRPRGPGPGSSGGSAGRRSSPGGTRWPSGCPAGPRSPVTLRFPVARPRPAPGPGRRPAPPRARG